MISRRIRAVRVATTIGRISRERREMMMKATGRTVVHLLSGSMRQMLRRSFDEGRFNVEVRRAEDPALSFWTAFSCAAICLPPHRHAILAAEMVANDRREFQRLRLAKPILGLLNGQNALILDVGISGAFIEHY